MMRRTRGVGFVGALVLAFGLVTVAAGASGKLDPSFGTRGITTTATAPGSGGDYQNGLAIRADRSILVGGSSEMEDDDKFRVSQYTKRGVLDATFGNGGTVLTSVSPDGFEHIWELALQPDGKVVAAGEASMGAGAGGTNFALVRYNRDGSLDTSFGGDGIVVTAVAPGNNRDNANAVALQADGKIVAAGGVRMGAANSNNDFVVVRYNVDGTLDLTFGGGDGIVTSAVAPGTRQDAFTGVAIQPDGKIVGGGQADMGPGAGRLNFAFARYNSDGSLDTSFGGDGFVVTAVAPGDEFDTAWEFALQPDGKVVGAGNAINAAGGSDVALARYNQDGSLDASFGEGGIVIAQLGPDDDDVWTVAIDAAGRIVIGGDTGSFPALDGALARFTGDGALDPSFGEGGVLVSPTSPDGGYDAFYEIALDKTGKIVASGECEQPATGIDVCVARFNAGDE